MRHLRCWIFALIFPVPVLGAPITAIGFVENVSTGATRLAFVRDSHSWHATCFFQEEQNMLKRQMALTDSNAIQAGWKQVLESNCANALLQRKWTVIEQDGRTIDVGHLNNIPHTSYDTIGTVKIDAAARAKLKPPFQMLKSQNLMSTISNLLIAVPEGTVVSSLQESDEPRLSKSELHAIQTAYLKKPRTIVICNPTSGVESTERPATLQDLKITPYLEYKGDVTFVKAELILASNDHCDVEDTEQELYVTSHEHIFNLSLPFRDDGGAYTTTLYPIGAYQITDKSIKDIVYLIYIDGADKNGYALYDADFKRAAVSTWFYH